jgi:hypothetical protein
MITQKTATSALGVVVALALAGCGTVNSNSKAGHHSLREIRPGTSHTVGKIALNKGARRFMQKVPVGATGYPVIGLVLAPAPASAVATPADVTRVLHLFYKSRAAQADLGAHLKSPKVTYAIITDYQPLFRDMKPGAKFSAIVLTYRDITCEALGPPSDHLPRLHKCTTMAFYDINNSRWLGIYQYSDPHLSAIKKT